MTALSLDSFKAFSQDIKLSHTLFSLPFVGATLVLAKVSIPLSTILFLVCSLTCARSFAMGINRYFDREIDARNPRTAIRAIPAKKLTAESSLMWTLLFAALFVLSTTAYNFTTFLCSFPVLAILALYPLTKKKTWLCHFYLGFCLSLSPVAALVALGQGFQSTSLIIGAAVLFWVCGFDIIYATQDVEIDKKEKLYSVPSYFGIKGALQISQVCFVVMLTLLASLGWMQNLGLFYWVGLLVISSILFFEQYSMTKMTSFDKINPIFFTANAWVSVIFFAFTTLDHLL